MLTDRPHVWVDPGRQFGGPCVAGTRVTVETVAVDVWSGGVSRSMEAVDLTREQVLVACWFHACWRPRGVKEGAALRASAVAWAGWVAEHERAIWESAWDQIPDPPSKADR